MKKLTLALAAIGLTMTSASAMPMPTNSTKPHTETLSITCIAPLVKVCRGWGRTVFCRCG